MSEEVEESCAAENAAENRECNGKALNKNVEYYVKAFKRLDETGKRTWNWAAFLFGPLWMSYRKMYLCGFIFLMIEEFFNRFIGDKNEILLLIIHLGMHLLFGYLGNAWYYDVVKARIKEGYHLLNKYSPTSFTSGISPFLGFLVCWADRISRKSQLKIKVESGINEGTIRAYLNSTKENPGVVKITNGIIWLLVIVAFAVMLTKPIYVPDSRSRVEVEQIEEKFRAKMDRIMKEDNRFRIEDSKYRPPKDFR